MKCLQKREIRYTTISAKIPPPPPPCVQTSLYTKTISMPSGLGNHSVRLQFQDYAVEMHDKDPASDKTFLRWSHVPLTVHVSYIQTI